MTTVTHLFIVVEHFEPFSGPFITRKGSPKPLGYWVPLNTALLVQLVERSTRMREAACSSPASASLLSIYKVWHVRRCSPLRETRSIAGGCLLGENSRDWKVLRSL